MPDDIALMPVSRALRITGLLGAALGFGSVLTATLVYVHAQPFSLFSTYLSDIGNTPVWPQVIFNSGQLVIAPVRYLFLILLIMQLRHLGAGRSFCWSACTLGALLVIGSIGMAAVPFALNLPLHKMSALLYFFGVVVLQSLIAAQEWRRHLPPILPISSIGVVVVYLTFAVLMTLVGKVEGVTRDIPVIWEWLAFCSLMVWLISHTIVLGRPHPGRPISRQGL